MEFSEVVKTRRSIREYSSKPIPEEVLKRVLLLAGKAPSGRNRQNWKYILVDDHKIKEELVHSCLDMRFIIDCPVTVVLCAQIIEGHNRGGYMGEHGALMDGAITFDHFTLAARSEGLGTCWIGRFDNQVIKELLKIPSGWNVVAVSPLGYPKNDEMFYENNKRLSYKELVSKNQF